MFHKIKNVSALPDYRLSVQFAEGCTKIYDMKDFDKISEMMEAHTDNFIKGAFHC